MNSVIAKTVNETMSDPFILSGPCRFRADDLDDGEVVTLYEERVDGGYEVAKDNGQPITLTKVYPSKVVEGYGNHKAHKAATKAAVAVGYAD